MHNLSIIIPFRDREEHLKKFIPHMNNFLSTTMPEIKYKIYVIEQNDQKPFNRAKLINVGFKETANDHNYFCFHDVDMLPVSVGCNYRSVEGACRLSHFVSQFNFIPRPASELGGGVVMIDKDSFIKINGFSNEYWGWGVEDNDFAERCRRKQIKVSFREGRYLSLSHESNGDTNGKPPSEFTIRNREHYRNIMQTEIFFNSGMDSLEYEKVNVYENPEFTRIVVNL